MDGLTEPQKAPDKPPREAKTTTRWLRGAPESPEKEKENEAEENETGEGRTRGTGHGKVQRGGGTHRKDADKLATCNGSQEASAE
eukprot:9040294-Pyramimonas_sp.AAC.1